MIEHVTKLRSELANDLKTAIAAFERSAESAKAIQSLFKNMELINDIVCRLLEMSLSNRELLQILTTWLDDQSKLLNATKARLDVFGQSKG